jgi:hypothetical protein
MLVSAVEAFEVCLCMFINVNVSLNVCSYTCSAGDITSDVSYVAEMAAALFHIRKELRLPEYVDDGGSCSNNVNTGDYHHSGIAEPLCSCINDSLNPRTETV